MILINVQKDTDPHTDTSAYAQTYTNTHTYPHTRTHKHTHTYILYTHKHTHTPMDFSFSANSAYISSNFFKFSCIHTFQYNQHRYMLAHIIYNIYTSVGLSCESIYEMDA